MHESHLILILGQVLILEQDLKTVRWEEGAGVQPWLIQGIRSGDGVSEDQDTIASIRY